MLGIWSNTRRKSTSHPSCEDYTPVSKNTEAGVEKKHQASLGPLTRLVTIIGLVVAAIFSLSCISIAFWIRIGSIPMMQIGNYSNQNLRLTLPPLYREFIFLALNLTFVKLSVYSINTAHHVALKWCLASEKDKHGKIRLEFNSNFRFLQSSQKWISANGLPANALMALCLALTYASSSMIFLGCESNEDGYNTVISYLPLMILGVVVLVQVLVCVWALSTTHIDTWSSSPFDTAWILLCKGDLERQPGRCMYSLYDATFLTKPRRPRMQQESAWRSHPEYRRFVLYIWLLIAVGYFWCFMIWTMVISGTQGGQKGESWSFIPNANNGMMVLGWEGEAPPAGILWGMGVLVGFQGGIVTTCFTCVDLLVLSSVDERVCHSTSLEGGAKMSPDFLKMLLPNWYVVAIYIADPLFHWVFGLAISLDAQAGLQIRYIQILYICLLGTAGIIMITAVTMFRPKRIMPSTYGHLQTIVNLVDCWPTSTGKVYWGTKLKHPRKNMVVDGEDKEVEVAHAGFSEDPSDIKTIEPCAWYGIVDDDRC